MDTKRYYSGLLFVLFTVLLAACGASEAAMPTPDPTTVALLVDKSFSAELTALSGESRQVDLTLTRDAESRLVFSLNYFYIGRSLAPTNRTGHWYFDGSMLTLDIIEQDGEPVEQESLTFVVDEEQLRGTNFDQSWFDVDSILLVEVPFQDFLE